jgi:hypothetical protein
MEPDLSVLGWEDLTTRLRVLQPLSTLFLELRHVEASQETHLTGAERHQLRLALWHMAQLIKSLHARPSPR